MEMLAEHKKREGKFMRKLVLAVALLALASIAFADNNPLITVDENGKGTINFGGGPIPLPGVIAADPGPGGLAGALTYNLLGPPALVAGDLLIQETVGAVVILSDWVRFNPAGTGGNPVYPASLVFYSERGDEPIPDLADTGFPTAQYTNVLSVLEVGPEGNNGFLYTPTANQPGFVPGFGVTYNIKSDVVPEPASASLFVIGGGMLLAGWRLRKRRPN